MTKKTRRKFTAKAKAVADYVSGIRSAQQIALYLHIINRAALTKACNAKNESACHFLNKSPKTRKVANEE